MFDVEIVIADWQQRVVAAGLHEAESVNELESHLRQSIEDLQRCGLSQEDACVLALRRLGEPTALGQEFAKVHTPWADRLLWMLVGVLAYEIAMAAAWLLRDLAMLGLAFTGLKGWPITVLAVGSVVASYAVVIALGRLAWKRAQTSPAALHPAIWATVSTVFIVASKFASTALWAVVSRLWPRDLGTYAYAYSVPMLTITVLLPIAICAGIMILQRRTGDAMKRFAK